MPRLPRLTAKKLITFLEARGFLLDHTSGSHFIFYNSSKKNRAVVPKHNTQLPKGTLLSILRESGFSKQDVVDFLRE